MRGEPLRKLLNEESLGEKSDETENNPTTNVPNNEVKSADTANEKTTGTTEQAMEKPPTAPPTDDHEETESGNENADGKSVAQGQSYQLEGNGPAHETSIKDIVNEGVENVISRPGTPGTWAFDEKEGSMHVKPPRPNSARSDFSPPIPRKAPVSVDHKLRK